jgi:hypothetical protein
LFILHTAPDASYARSIAELSKFDINEAMRDLKARLYERSCFGCRELTSIFQAMDKAGSHRLDVDDFRWGLMDYGVQISKEDAHELQAHFDNEGQVNWRAFLDSLVVSIYFFLSNHLTYYRELKTGMKLEKQVLGLPINHSMKEVMVQLPSIK